MKISKIYEWKPYEHESIEKEIPKGWNVVCELARDEKITCGRCGRVLKGHESEQSIFLSDGAGKSVLICKECKEIEKKEAAEAKKRKWKQEEKKED